MDGQTVSGALDIIRQVTAAGGRLCATDDGSLQVSAPTPLPDALVEALRAHKPAVLAALGPVAVPIEWTAGVACMQAMVCPAVVRPDRWRLAVIDARRFVDRWGSKATALGWQTIDVFGAHPTHPVERVDSAGLILCLHGDEPLAITTETARIRARTGAVLTYYRRPLADAVPLWKLT